MFDVTIQNKIISILDFKVNDINMLVASTPLIDDVNSSQLEPRQG